MSDSNDWSGFYKRPLSERQRLVAERFALTEPERQLLAKEGPLPLAAADHMSENVIGTVGLPLAVAPHFTINGRACTVPMAVEEPSVVAAASYAAKLANASGGFKTTYTGSVMIGQVQLVGCPDIARAQAGLDAAKPALLESARGHTQSLAARGGGVREVGHRLLKTDRGPMIVVEFLVDVVDAMGANMVNTLLEKMSPELEKTSGGKSRLRILSNLATHRLASATAVWRAADIGGPDVVEGILDGWTMAMADPYRRATHNKGVMNGVDAVALACGQDWRAVEAGAHGYAALKGAALTTYRKRPDGDIEGRIVLPLAVGTVGGSIKTNPTAALCLKIAGVKTSGELAQVMAAVGLAQNFAALRAMASEGIQAGHMRLHARQVAQAAGASDAELDAVVERMAAAGALNETGAKAALEQIRKKNA